MEPLFLCIVVITSVNGKEKAGGMCNGSSNDFNTGSRSSKHDLYDRYAGYHVRSDVFLMIRPQKKNKNGSQPC